MTRPRPTRQRTVAGLLGETPADLSQPDAVTVLAVDQLRARRGSAPAQLR